MEGVHSPKQYKIPKKKLIQTDKKHKRGKIKSLYVRLIKSPS